MMLLLLQELGLLVQSVSRLGLGRLGQLQLSLPGHLRQLSHQQQQCLLQLRARDKDTDWYMRDTFRRRLPACCSSRRN